MRLKNMVTAFITVIAMASFGTISAFAEEETFIQVQGTNEVISWDSTEAVDIYFNNLSRGKDKPSTSNVYNLSINSYKGYIENFSYGLYTNYWFTGKSTMTLTLTGSSIYDYFTNTAIERVIYVRIFEQGVYNPIGYVEISSEDPIYSSYTITAQGLDSSKKYVFYIGKTADTESLSNIQIDIS